MQWSLILLFLMGQSCFISCQLYEYHFIREEKTWTEAQQYCREKHIDLATVSNMRDMVRLMNNSQRNMRESWIGLYDPTYVKKTWYWSLPGVEFNVNETNWSSGNPNATGLENCGILYKNLKWADTDCHHPRCFICYGETNITHKYHLIREQKTWQEAQNYCRENHTDLISGLKQLLDEELEKVMNSTSSDPYFGLFRDTWRWSDGSSFSFRHWNLQFKNQQPNSDQCAMIGFDDEGRWKNEDCTVRKPFICYDDKVILIKENKTWEDALNYCRTHQDDLATITSLDEHRWVMEKVKNASTPFVWIGLRYFCLSDVWFWVCKEMVTYQNQASKEGLKDCDISGAIETGGQHRLFQKSDRDTFNFLCSKA